MSNEAPADMDSPFCPQGPETDISDHPLSSNLAIVTTKMGKAKQEWAKKAAKQADLPTGFICANCQAPFTSKRNCSIILENFFHEQPLGSGCYKQVENASNTFVGLIHVPLSFLKTKR